MEKDDARENGNGIRPYADVIPDSAVSDEGLFTLHRVGEDWLYEVPLEHLGREMILITRITQTASGISFGGHRQTTEQVRWERRNDQLLLRQVSFANVADPDLPIYQAVRNSNFEPVLASFPIRAESPDGSGVVVNVSDFFLSDAPIIGLTRQRRQEYDVRRLDPPRTWIESMRSFPENIEIRRVVTYEAQNPPSNQAGGTLSVEFGHSLMLLPLEPMTPRLWDERVGYFSTELNDFGTDAQRVFQQRYIQRFRLEPSDTAAYLRGELVDPVEPIVFYIDPATPEKWRPWLAQGVEDWQEAYEAAGFKNAIVARMPPTPEEDPEWDPADARISIIRYLASPVQNAMGPRFFDPRTGEILGTHIQWHHNVMNLLRNWYFVQTSATNPPARGVEFADEVMGELIRFVSAHEVGHTIGLPHNQKGHSAIPVDSLRTRWVCRNGTSTSVMDYARFNYVAQPGDDTCYNPRIGPYDRWSIEWGHRWIPEASTPQEEKPILNGWIREKENDPLYRFGDPTSWDPGSLTEALGDDAVRSSDLGVENLKRTMANLQEWTRQEGEDYSQLRELYGQVLGQWNRYVGHVAANLGGVDWTRRAQGQSQRPYTPISGEMQRRALDYMDRQVFQTPTWMLDADILWRIQYEGATDRIRQLQTGALNQVLNVDRMKRLVEQEALGTPGAYPLSDFMADLTRAVWTEFMAGRTIDPFRRNLQRAHLERLGALMEHEEALRTDIVPLARGQLQYIRREAATAARGSVDTATRLHLEDVVARVDALLDP
ncbi:MAG: zinc-dependent metalloprotease [Gemmatimonadota bacterium]